MKEDLSNFTFMIPVRIDSSDRLRNIFLTINYLLHNFETNIIIKESDKKPILEKYLSDYKNIKYIFEQSDDDAFHRTRFLNDMILESKTEIVVNYDADIVLPVDSYLKSKLMFLYGYDIVYPFRHGSKGEKKVLFKDKYNFLENIEKLSSHEFYSSNFNTEVLEKNSFFAQHPFGEGYADFGMCQFFKKDVYVNGFLENENFISYAPEDKERHYRFQTLGYNIGRIDNYAYHLEHYRGNNSSSSNPYMQQNNNLWNIIKNLKKQDLIDYYKKQDYYKKRLIK